MEKIIIEIEGRKFSATLFQNSSVESFKKRLPLTIIMDDLHGNEKYHYLSEPLQKKSERIGSIKKGDLMLFGSDCLVLFYKGFSTSYSYSRIATLDNKDGLTDIDNRKSIQVTFRLQKTENEKI